MAVKIAKPALPDEYLVDNRVYTEERVFRQEQEKIFFASGILSAMKAKSSDLEITLRPCRLGSRLFVCHNSTGGRERAVSGTLAVMVGGTEDAFERARPVLSCIGKDLFHLGPSGSGNVVKLIVQMIYLPYVAAFCEGLALGEKMGIPFDRLFSVLIKSSAGQPGFEKRVQPFESGRPHAALRSGHGGKGPYSRLRTLRRVEATRPRRRRCQGGLPSHLECRLRSVGSYSDSVSSPKESIVFILPCSEGAGAEKFKGLLKAQLCESESTRAS